MRGSPPIQYNARREKLWRKFLAALAVWDTDGAWTLELLAKGEVKPDDFQYVEPKEFSTLRERIISTMDVTQ